MKSFKQHLQEKNVQTLYHATSLYSFHDILISRKIKTSRLTQTETWVTGKAMNMSVAQADEYMKHNHIKGYVSFARHPRNGFTAYNHGATNSPGWTAATAILKCDGRKLARYGKVIPVDYGAMRKIGDGMGSEQEERLLSKRLTIPLYEVVLEMSIITANAYDAELTEKIIELDNRIKVFKGATIEAAWKNYFRSRP